MPDFSSVCSKITRGRIFLLFSFCFLLFVLSLHHCNGEMQEWLNWLAWKAGIPQKGIGGSNPPLSAPIRRLHVCGQICSFFLCTCQCSSRVCLFQNARSWRNADQIIPMAFGFYKLGLKRVTDGQIQYQSVFKSVVTDVKIPGFTRIVRSMQSNSQISANHNVCDIIT